MEEEPFPMTAILQHRCGNSLLNCLSPADFRLLEPHLVRVSMEPGQVILSPNAQVRHVCFPEGGVTSFHDVLADGSRIGIGIIGFEGLTGWPVLLGSDVSRHEACVVIAAGTALRICPEKLREACLQSATLNDLLLRFVHAFLSQMGRTIVSNLADPVESRLCRWLLMNHDRLVGDEIRLKHSQIGVMLGVRRATVTDTLHVLEGEGLIRARRENILIRSREGLRRRAGEAYGEAEAEYCRLIGPFGKDAPARTGAAGACHPPGTGADLSLG